MKVAVIGGGVSGLIAAYYAQKILSCPVTIFSDEIGGEFLKGGLKYIHLTPYSKQLIQDLNIKYQIKKVNGAVYWKGETYLHPEIFWYGNELGHSIQLAHWNKTRGTKVINQHCMNNPWVYNPNLKIELDQGIWLLVDQLRRNVFSSGSGIDYERMVVDGNTFNDIMITYDFIIFTIPFSTIEKNYSSVLPKSKKKFYKSFVYKYITKNLEDVWFDYLYVPEMLIPAHRFSINDKHLEIEISEINYKTEEDSKKCVDWFSNKFKCDYFSEYSSVSNIQGHIVNYDGIESAIPKKLFLLGRYAQMNSRITTDKVVERIFQKLNEVKNHGI